MKPRKAKVRSGSLPLRSETRIAKTLLARTLPATDSHVADGDAEAFDAFHMEMKKTYQPQLPVQFDVVERAAKLRWRLRKVSAWEAKLISAMTDAFSPEAVASPEIAERSTRALEVVLRNNGLEKVAKYEAALREEVRKSDRDLEAIFDWMIRHGQKRGSIGYTISHRLDWEDPVRYEAMMPPESQSTAK
jgi:hypothetical protein